MNGGHSASFFFFFFFIFVVDLAQRRRNKRNIKEEESRREMFSAGRLTGVMAAEIRRKKMIQDGRRLSCAERRPVVVG